MATNERFMPVEPEVIWDVLAEPANYAYWVVGSKVIRDADPHWPEPGAKFHHTIGVGPLKVSDHSEVIDAHRPGLFKLRAKGRPLGTAMVTMRMIPRGAAGGTVVEMTENPDGIFGALSLNPLTHVFTIARNAESLMRLEELALLQARDGAPA